jgi:hypothetical protein
MVKRISLFVMIFTVCIFAQNTAKTKQAAPAEAVSAVETVQAEPVAAEAAPAAEAVQAEPAAAEAEPVAAEAAPAAETTAVAPVVSATPAAAEPAKETFIDNPVEFAIVTAVFVATVLLITLTGN